MKVSWQWLQQFVPLTVDPLEGQEKLTLHTAEVEEVIKIAPFFENIVVGFLRSVQAHPKNPKLSVGKFDIGQKELATIIFGERHPLHIGTGYPTALPGAKLMSGREILETTIQETPSQGMVCDGIDLGWKNNGLWSWTKDQAKPGTPLLDEVKTLGDTIIDIDNKSLTHRPDLFGHRGLARECFAIFDSQLTLPEPLCALNGTKSSPEVTIENAEVCRRYCALRIDQVKPQPDIPSRQARLETLGVRSINQLVDLTNELMLEYGQPMHVFDSDKIEGSIVVRFAKKGEKLLALDEETYELSSEDLVIADDKKVLAIAGVMGGAESGVTEKTKNIVFECAHFESVTIRQTSYRLGLRTESSMRFEKSLDPEVCRTVILAAAERLSERQSQIEMSYQITDEFPSPLPTKEINLSLADVSKTVGYEFSQEQVEETLNKLGFELIDHNEGEMTWRVPSNRTTKDINLPIDLVEEVVRLHGFENIPCTLPQFPIAPAVLSSAKQQERSFRDFWNYRGWNEVLHYSLVDDQEEQFASGTTGVKIQNPLSSRHQLMRQTLFYPHWQSLESPLRTHRVIKQFELGRVYDWKKDRPVESEQALVLWSEIGGDENQMFREFKTLIDHQLRHQGLDFTLQPLATNQDWQHPHKGLCWQNHDGQPLVELRAVTPPTRAEATAPLLYAVWFFENNKSEKTSGSAYKSLSLFPAARRDLSLVLPQRTYTQSLIDTAYQTCPFLQSMEVFDDFEDLKKLGADKRSVSFHLTFRSRSHTLSEAEIQQGFDSLVAVFAKNHHAVLRLEFDQQKTTS